MPVAISVARLRREPVFAFEAGGRHFIVITSKAGANMLFERTQGFWFGWVAQYPQTVLHQ